MLPENVFSTNDQYTQDAHDIASWLTTTAKELGFKPKFTLKASGDHVSTYIVPTREYAVLAEFIAANHGPSVRVPESFSVSLDRAIATRQRFAAPEPQPDDSLEEGHSDDYNVLLEALTRVRHILSPRDASSSDPRMDATENLHEPHATLSKPGLQSTSAAENRAQEIVMTPSVEEGNVKYEADLPGGRKDDQVAFQLFLEDLHKLRTQVLRAWSDYKEGSADVVTASLVTDTAVCLARSMEDDCQKHGLKHGGLKSMLDRVYYNMSVVHDARAGHSGSLDDVRLYDVANGIFLFPFNLLLAYMAADRTDSIPIYNARKDMYDPTSDRASKTVRGRFDEDSALLFQMLTESEALIDQFEPAPAEDELTLGLRRMLETHEVTISLAFAVQLFFDIHITLRDDHEVPFWRLSAIASFARNNMKANLRFHDSMHPSMWSSKDVEKMQIFDDCIYKYILADPHRQACRNLGHTPLQPPYFFLRRHPWACGLWKYYIQTHLYRLSMSFNGALGAVKACVHLYNALREEQLIECEWPDMRDLFEVRGNEYLFGGDTPRCRKEYYKHFRFNKTDCLTGALFVLNELKRKYCWEDPKSDFRASDVKTIIHRMGVLSNMVSTDPVTGVECGPKKSIFAPEMLFLLRATAESEMEEFSFDYLTLHRSCWSLLRSLKDKTLDMFVPCVDEADLQDESKLPSYVGYILITASIHKRIAPPALFVAAKVVEEMAKSEKGESCWKTRKDRFGIVDDKTERGEYT